MQVTTAGGKCDRRGAVVSVNLVRGFGRECECAGHRRDLSERLIQRVTRRARGASKDRRRVSEKESK
jgi:hypothetical protein